MRPRQAARRAAARLLGVVGAERLPAGLERRRLAGLPRLEPTTTSLLGLPPLEVLDAASFLSAHAAIWEHELYAFAPASPAPRIVDCGANVGLGVLWWKRRFPGARITAFEPDPAIFAALRENCRRRGLDDVELVQKAVWREAGPLEFLREGADAGRAGAVAAGPAGWGRITVEAVRLRDLLVEPIDLLKVDIEGAEVDVLLDCADRLGQVERLFVEYHSFAGRPQRLDELLTALRRAGLRTHLAPELVAPRPLLGVAVDGLGMDQRLNLFAQRASAAR